MLDIQFFLLNRPHSFDSLLNTLTDPLNIVRITLVKVVHVLIFLPQIAWSLFLHQDIHHSLLAWFSRRVNVNIASFMLS